MISSASQVSTVEAPEQVQSWNDFYNDYMHGKYGDAWNGHEQSPDHWTQAVNNFFTGDVSKAKNLYDAYLNNVNIRNESKATQSARAYDEYMSNTAYSRAFADLERAGINPYMLINNGSTPSTTVGSSSKASYSAKSTKEATSNTKGRDMALILLAIARLAAALA